MSVKFLYATAPGRLLLKGFMQPWVRKTASWFLYTPCSKVLIKSYIKKNDIKMDEYIPKKYKSFADFFAREKVQHQFDRDKNVLISPCDGWLSVYPIEKDMSFQIKDSWYQLNDLISDDDIAKQFQDGLCLIIRLCASDYHHFCYIDDCYHYHEKFIEGKLHSVQPIACEKYPVYRLNRRKWSMMDTENFGTVVQVEIGALLVGGMAHEKTNVRVSRGDEMGHFELCGSTIALFLNQKIKNELSLREEYLVTLHGKEEKRVLQGNEIGVLSK